MARRDEDAARDVFAEVDEALGQKLSVLMREGPEDQLTLTENAQPALMAVSVAAIRALKAEFGFDVASAAYVAGHSLGEYSALCAAGAISLSDTARLLCIRGTAMQEAVPVGVGAMAAILGAALNGLQDRLDCPPPISGNAYDHALDQLPASWGAAIDAFERCPEIKRILPQHLIDNLVMTKRQELHYMAELSDEETVELYLDTV